MAKVLCIGDPHFQRNNLVQMQSVTSSILKIVQESNLDAVVVLGDTLDRHEIIHMAPLMAAMKFLKSLSDLVYTIVLIGNHDRINNSVFQTDESPFWACKFWPNITIVDTAQIVHIAQQRFLCVPYVMPGLLAEAISGFDLDSVLAVFAHQEMYGCNLGAIKSAVGDKWPESHPLMISGHIHEYQRLGPNIIYAGTPYMKTFGDGKSKTVSLFKFRIDRTWEEERIDLGVPKKITIKTTIGELVGLDVDPGTRLIITGSDPEITVFSKSILYRNLCNSGVKIVFKSCSVCKDIDMPPVQSRDAVIDRLNERMKANQHIWKTWLGLFSKSRIKIACQT